MTPVQETDPVRFVQMIEPLLAERDIPGLISALKSNYTPDQIHQLLQSHDDDARKVALLAMALVGPTQCIPELVKQLRDPDPVTNQLAEHALWAIWFRGGKCSKANRLILHGVEALNHQDFNRAIDLFSVAIKHDPNFAEAYNQRAIAYYLVQDWDRCMQDCRRVIARMPCHFGAWSGMGHCHLHLGELAQAADCYQKSLDINPHMECLRQTVDELRKRGHSQA